MLKKFLLVLILLSAAFMTTSKALAIPAGPIALPGDAKLEFVCGPFMLNGKPANLANETRIYFSHYLLNATDPDEIVYLVFNGDTSDGDPLDTNQADPKTDANGNVTKYFAGGAPDTMPPQNSLAKLALTYDKNGQPVAADLTAVTLTFHYNKPMVESLAGTAACVLQK